MKTAFRRRAGMALMFTVTALLGGVSFRAGATTLEVPSELYPSIQSALNNTEVGDTVRVAPGTYMGADNRDLEFQGRNAVLMSSGGPEVTIIDCEFAGRGFSIHTNETLASRIIGFTVINGSPNGAGGAFLFTGAAATVENCRLIGNFGGPGGAISVTQGGTPRFVNCIIEENVSAEPGGAVHVSFASPTFDNCTIRGNRSSVNSGAAAIFSAGSTTFNSCLVTGNAAPDGGAFSVRFGATLTIAACTVAGNEASGQGGAVRIDNGSLSFQNSIIRSNCAATGPAVWIDNGLTLSTSCSFIEFAEIAGGGTIQPGANNSDEDPLFCDPLDCGDAPSVGGDYGLASTTPVLGLFECGTIGALGVACDEVPVSPATWSGIKVRCF